MRVALVLWSLLALAPAQEPLVTFQDPTAGGAGVPFDHWGRLTGDWGGLRSWLETEGIEVGGSMIWDWSAAWRGGIRNRDSVNYLLDANVTLDLESLLGLPRTTAFLDAYSVQGRDPTGDVGDVNVRSNIEGPDTDQLAEAWVETWLGDRLRLKFGKVDVNADFTFCEQGVEFTNSAIGITPTIPAAPTFPDPATSVNVFWSPYEDAWLGLGVYDGALADGVRTGRHGFGGFFDDDPSDSYFVIAEASRSWVDGTARIAVGAWHHSARFDRFDGGTERGTEGLYAVVEHRFWRENPEDPNDRQGLGAFVRGGLADDAVAEIEADLQAGLTWTGPFDGRDDDVLGLAVSQLWLSDHEGSGFVDDEMLHELFYLYQLTPWIGIKPGLHFIASPGGDPAIDDALIGVLRVEIVF